MCKCINFCLYGRGGSVYDVRVRIRTFIAAPFVTLHEILFLYDRSIENTILFFRVCVYTGACA